VGNRSNNPEKENCDPVEKTDRFNDNKIRLLIDSSMAGILRI